MTAHYWEMHTHLRLGDQRIRVERCKTLGICRQTVVRSKDYRVLEEFCFFEGECGPDDPTCTLKEILTEVKYRQAVRDGDEGLEVDG